MKVRSNEIIQRAQVANIIIGGALFVLLSGFFRSQVLQQQKYALQSEKNRLRELPLPAPRGLIYDRNGKIIADNVTGYSVSVLELREDSLRAILERLGGTITITPGLIDQSVRRFRRAPGRPTVILPDASFDVVSVLEEHRTQFPGLIIQASPRRFYPDGPIVASFAGNSGEISEEELGHAQGTDYKAGQQIGKRGLEKQYESVLRGKEGSQFVEVDARGRIVKNGGARPDLSPVPAPPLYTSIDMDLQRATAAIFGDTLQGGAVAMDPRTGEILALYSAPSWDANRFIGGIPAQYWDSLNADPRRPMYNKALQGTYPPGSTFKLATSIVALENHVVSMDEHMPIPCTGGMQYGSRYFRCDGKHGSLSLAGAIAVSCDVYFYQLGLKLGISKLLAGGVDLGFRERTGIDLPDEHRPLWPETIDYYNRRYGKSGWTSAAVLNLSIGQGENSQTVLNMARFYSALATDGMAPRPSVLRHAPERKRIFTLPADELAQLRAALANVVQTGTAASAKIQGVTLAGKTGTAQSGKYGRDGKELNHAWFVGFAPVDDPKIVVAVMLEHVPFHGVITAQLASKIIGAYLHVKPVSAIVN
ncbi:MAG: penicillin-binding protein 2 [bacterium]